MIGCQCQAGIVMGPLWGLCVGLPPAACNHARRGSLSRLKILRRTTDLLKLCKHPPSALLRLRSGLVWSGHGAKSQMKAQKACQKPLYAGGR